MKVTFGVTSIPTMEPWIGIRCHLTEVAMLSTGRLGIAGDADYYLGNVPNSVDDYYLGRGKPPVQWIGNESEQLGLAERPSTGGAWLIVREVGFAQGCFGRGHQHQVRAENAPRRTNRIRMGSHGGECSVVLAATPRRGSAGL
jgi:hypothetical protein